MFKEAVGRALLPSLMVLAGMLNLFVMPDVLAAQTSKELRVKKDSYLVVLNDEEALPTPRTRQISGVPKQVGGFRGDRIGKSKRGGAIVRYQRQASTMKAMAAAVIEDEFVPYDSSDATCVQLVKELKTAASCSPDFEVHVNGTGGENTPWGISAINSEQAWDKTTGSDSVVVAVLDTGVDYNHKDIAANMWVNPREAPNGIDDDGNGIIDDIHGMNAIDDSGNPMDDNGHGTHVAGTIGAINNGVGVIGVNWNVRIIALKFLSSSGSGSLSAAIKAMDYLLELKKAGVHVRAVNNSWGGGGFSDALYDVFKRAGDAGIVLAVAAGNESNDNDANPTYPASFDLDNLISVAAIDDENNVASFSNYGASTVDIAAPGVSILSLAPGNRYATMSGTSMATPHVTGALALLSAADPSLNGAQLISRLHDSGVARSSLSGVVRTGRALDVGRAVLNVTDPLPAQPDPTRYSYTMEKVAFNPDESADTESISLEGDELEFKSVPFRFSFFGSEAHRVVLSLNGLAYIDKTPGDMDFKNFSKPLPNSIAALHTDLVAPGGPYGLRYKVEDNGSKLNASWRMHHYSNPAAGDVRIWLTIERSGVIKSCASIDPDLREGVGRSATLGLSGSSQATALTYAYNNASIDSQFCILYTPQSAATQPAQPGDGPASISKLKLSGMQRGAEVLAGKRMRIRGTGSGTGTATLTATINGHSCSVAKPVSVRKGRATHTAIVPRRLDRQARSRITVRLDRAKASQYVYGAPRSSGRGKKLTHSQLDTLCNALMSSVK